MKMELRKAIRLTKYSLSLKMNLICMVTMLVLGLLMEWVFCYVNDYQANAMTVPFLPISMGTFFIICAALFPAQMVISLDVGTMVQTSPYKRKLQTLFPTVLNGVSMTIALLLVVLIRGISWVLTGKDYVWDSLLYVGVIAAVLMVYSMFVYKFFVLSIIVLYFVMFFGGFTWGIITKTGRFSFLSKDFAANLSPVVAVLLSIGMIVIASMIHYGATRLLYKRPLSKYAFGAALQRASR